LPPDRTWERRTLLTGGTVLVLLGFLYGAWYAGMDLYSHEAREAQILKTMLDGATSSQGGSAAAVGDYGSLAAERAVKIAAHSHVIEFGLLAILLSFVQPYVYLSEGWKRRWVMVLLAGSVILPVFVLLLRCPAKYWPHPKIAPAGALAVVLVLDMVDNMFNSMYDPSFFIAAGALMGLTRHSVVAALKPSILAAQRRLLPASAPQVVTARTPGF